MWNHARKLLHGQCSMLDIINLLSFVVFLFEKNSPYLEYSQQTYEIGSSSFFDYLEKDA